MGEIKGLVESGKVKILAIMSPERLKGDFANYPTAIEQGYDAEWTILRGYYLGPKVSDEAYNYWTAQFQKAYKNPAFEKVIVDQNLVPFNMSGDALDSYIKERVAFMRGLAQEAGLTN